MVCISLLHVAHLILHDFTRAEHPGMPTVTSPQEIELRCPVGPRKLFAKLRLEGVQPIVTSGNLLEMACQDCRRRLRSEGRTDIGFVLHRFDIVGRLVETVIVAPVTDGAEYPSEG
jgi:hypothetical protein